MKKKKKERLTYKKGRTKSIIAFNIRHGTFGFKNGTLSSKTTTIRNRKTTGDSQLDTWSGSTHTRVHTTCYRAPDKRKGTFISRIWSTGKTDKSRRKPWPCDIKARSKPCSPCKIKMVRIYFSIKDTVVLLLATKIEPIVIPYNVSRWILFFLVRLVLRDRTCWWKWHMSLSPSVWMLLMYAVPFFLRLGLRWCRVHILTNDQAKHPFGRVHNR